MSLIGPRDLYCNPPTDGSTNAEWSYDIPTCGSRTKEKCPQLITPNTHIECTEEQYLGSICQFR